MPKTINFLAAALALALGASLASGGENLQEERRAAMAAGAGGNTDHKKEEKKDEKKEAEAPPAPPAPPEQTDRYVHHWLKMPPIAATRIPGGPDQEKVESVPGRMLVVVFLASWCEPCQQLMPQLQRLEKHYKSLNSDFVYVFTHDTADDAAGFAKEFNMDSVYLANYTILHDYHNPELPSIYVGDRRGWLTTRYLKAGAKEVTALDGLLANLTSF